MLYAAVLAGGLSSRMGQDKTSLRLSGESLLERARRVLKEAGADTVLVSGKAEVPGGVPDLLAHCGPPGGLYSLLEHFAARQALDASPLLLIPADMPKLSAATLRILVAGAQGAQAAHFADEVFPCLFNLTPELHAHLRELFREGRDLGGKRSMKAILRFCDARVLPTQGIAGDEFGNVNTPEDWALIEDGKQGGA